MREETKAAADALAEHINALLTKVVSKKIGQAFEELELAWDQQSRSPQPVQGGAESVADEERFDDLLIKLSVALYEGGKRGDNEAGVAETEALRTFFKQFRQSPRAGMVSVPLRTANLNLPVIRERNAAIDPHSLGSIYACDVVALIDDVSALQGILSHSSKGDEHGK